jgi:hypothetical protein
MPSGLFYEWAHADVCSNNLSSPQGGRVLRESLQCIAGTLKDVFLVLFSIVVKQSKPTKQTGENKETNTKNKIKL